MTTYTVQSGDSLSRIASRVLGNMSLWPQIAALNNISAPYVIYPGQMLQLPDGSSGASASAPARAPVATAVARSSSGQTYPVPAASSAASGGILQWVMANKRMIGGGIAVIAVIMLAMGAKKTASKRRK